MQLGKLKFVDISTDTQSVPPVVLSSTEENHLLNVFVSEIDPTFADTTAFCEAYDIGMDVSANCVIVEAKRAEKTWYAACVVLATSKADINGIVRKHLGARKISFAPMDKAVSMTGMEYGGITPIGLPIDWPVIVDSRVNSTEKVIIGSGLRKSKLLIPGKLLASLPNALVLDIAKK
jgi:prolyl-tRNA editing enzyme YbaK/EbsC (Cys-tRNA(Pro) deacylase)